MRYKYSQNTNEVSTINFDTTTHGEYLGMEQGGEMKKLSLPKLIEFLLPYSGATNNLDLGAHNITAIQAFFDSIHLSTTPATIPSDEDVGSLYWDDDALTYTLVLPNGVRYQFGEEMYANCVRDASAPNPILNGTPVYVTGESGQRPTIDVARADDSAKREVRGLATHDISNQGRITTFGLVREISQSVIPSGETWVAGNKLWLAPAGGMTNVEPSSPMPNVKLGMVLNVTGSASFDMMVCVRLATGLYDLYDVNGDAPTTTGQILVWNEEEGYWQSSNDLIDLNTTKADKDTDAIEGNLASFDPEGNPVDSGIAPDDKANASDVLTIKGTGWTDENLVDHETRIDTLESDLGDAEINIADLQDGLATESSARILKDVEQDNRLDTHDKQLEVTKTLDSGDERISEEDVTINGVGYDSSGDPLTNIASTVVDGRFGSMMLKGKSGENEVENGDFAIDSNSDGRPDDWGIVRATSSITSKVVSITGTSGTDTQFYQSNVATAVAGDVWFFPARARVTNALATYMQLILEYAVGDESVIKSITSPTENLWYDMGVVFTIPAGRSGLFLVNLRAYYADATGKTMQVDGNYGVMAQNLTQQGLATYLSTYAKASRYFKYITGSAPSLPHLWESVGKNLWDAYGLADKIISFLGDSFAYRTVDGGKNCLALKGSGLAEDYVILDNFTPDTRYTFSITARRSTANAGMLFEIAYTDGTKYPLFLGPSATFETRVISSDAGKSIKHIEFIPQSDGWILYDLDTFMVNLGSSALPHEPYKVQSIQIPYLSYRLPNLVANTYSPETGEEVRNVSDDYVLTESDIIAVVTTRTNLDTVDTKAPLNADMKLDNASDSHFYIDGWGRISAGGFTDSLDNVGKIFFSGTNGLRFCVAKGTYADVAAAQAALTGTVIYYQLATPVTIQHAPITPTLFEGGSQTLSPSYADSYITDASSQFTIPYSTSAIESVYGYDEDGEYEVPSTGYSLSGNTVTMLTPYDGENVVYYVRATLDEDATLTPTTSGYYPVENIVTRVEELEAKVCTEIADATGTGDIVAQFNALLATMKTKGLMDE